MPAPKSKPASRRTPAAKKTAKPAAKPSAASKTKSPVKPKAPVKAKTNTRKKPAAKPKSPKEPPKVRGEFQWTKDIEDRIIERLSDGEFLRAICRDADMPAFRTVYQRMERDEAFDARIARAREVGYDCVAEDCVAIADDLQRARTREDVRRARLRVNTRLDVLAKLSPRKYGAKLGIGGAEGLPPVRTAGFDASKLSSQALDEFMNARSEEELDQ